MQFLYHDDFNKEIAALKRRFRTVGEGLKIFERLCTVQFHPTNPKQVIAPAKLHRLSQNEIWSLWKVELVLPRSGLKPNQMPRMWFAVKGDIIAFLCINSHVDNYDDNEVVRDASLRVNDIF